MRGAGEFVGYVDTLSCIICERLRPCLPVEKASLVELVVVLILEEAACRGDRRPTLTLPSAPGMLPCEASTAKHQHQQRTLSHEPSIPLPVISRESEAGHCACDNILFALVIEDGDERTDSR